MHIHIFWVFYVKSRSGAWLGNYCKFFLSSYWSVKLFLFPRFVSFWSENSVLVRETTRLETQAQPSKWREWHVSYIYHSANIFLKFIAIVYLKKASSTLQEIFWYFNVSYSILLHLPPLCRRMLGSYPQYCCDFGVAVRRTNHSARSHPQFL